MSRRGENIHKRKDGRWEARLNLTDGYGNSKRISLYGKTYKEVREKKLSVQSEHGRTVCKEAMTVSEVIDEWLINNNVNRKKATKLKYMQIIEKHIRPQLGDYDIKNMDENVINIFLSDKLSNGRLSNHTGLSSSYVNTMGIILNSVITYAIAKEYCCALKTKVIKPVSEKKEKAIMDVESQRRLEEKLQNDYSLTALGIIIALNTGLRIGELCALKWDDIDLTNAVIHVRHTVARVGNADIYSSQKTCLVLDKPKTRSSERDIPITNKLYSLLERYQTANTDYVVSGTEQFLSPRTFEYRYHQILKKYSIPQLNFHSLRHSFATRCIEHNVDVKSLSEILGHANIGITLNTYVHSSFEFKRSQLEKLSEI